MRSWNATSLLQRNLSSSEHPMYPGEESLSGNVKMGLQMKMKLGELVGFNGCFGYDYHQDTKTITVNETEAETVRLIDL